jgi:hypothetical protein
VDPKARFISPGHIWFMQWSWIKVKYTDLAGRIPVRFSKVNWYVMVVYSFDGNYINPVVMKSKSASEWLTALEASSKS